MALARDFKYLQLHEYLADIEESPDVDRRLLRAVTAKGLSYAGLPSLDHPLQVTLSRHGLLQICLQRLDLFQQCADTEVQDRHVTPIEVRRCRNRPLLLDALADALLAYEETLGSLEAQAQGMPDHMREALSTVGLAAAIYTHLRARRALAAEPPHPPVRKATIERAEGTFHDIIETLSPADYLRAAGITRAHYRTQSCLRMRDAFLTYGPPRREFPDEAVYHAIALILCHLKVEKVAPDIDTGIPAVVKRLRRRAERAQRSPAL